MQSNSSVGIGTRVLNLLIDNFIVFSLAFVFYSIYKWYVFYWNKPYIAMPVFFCGTLILYYLIMEGIWSCSLGKKITQTIVKNKQGNKPSFVQILIRTLTRLTVVDCFFIPFLNEPLHDYLSHTTLREKE